MPAAAPEENEDVAAGFCEEVRCILDVDPQI